jgi:hypothetical protein
MKKSHESGLATHIDPESCGAAREGGVDRGTCGPGIQPRKKLTPGRRRCQEMEGPIGVHRYREVCLSPATSETLCTYEDTSRGNREIPSPPKAAVAVGRVGKSKGVRR